MKRCTKCKRILEINSFRKDSSKKDGIYPSCNDCHRKRTGAKKLEHKIIGSYNGHIITDGNPYPNIIGINEQKRAHVYIMEDVLGRKVDKDEHVHHIDGNKKNFRLDNLVVLKKDVHRKIHGEELSKKWRNGEVFKCNNCGKQKYQCKSLWTKHYSSIEKYRKVYLCKACYYQSKRWIRPKR